MKKLFKRLALIAITFVAVFGVFAPRSFAANGEYSKPECDGFFQNLTCTSLDHIASFMAMAYEIFVDYFLEISPATFDYEYIGSPGHALHTAWSSVRGLANIAFGILLFVVVLSQITGIGISNYGVKKMLPRMIAGIVMVNLSYLICQGAIDLANILGSGLGSMFEDLMIDSIPPDINFTTGGGTALMTLMIGVVSFLVITAKGLGTKIILLVILGFVAILLAVCLLFVVSVVRQALCILLVVFAPIAFVCYMLPGTKSIFSKWFSLFKGILFAYPICSLMIYGGSYAGAVIYGTWTDSGSYAEILRNLSFLLIVTVPYFLIPSVIMKSLGAAESAMARLNGFLQKNGRGAFRRQRWVTDLERRADQNQQLARAGYKRTWLGFGNKIVPKKQTINANDNKAKKFVKRAYNASLRARNFVVPTAPYVKNAVRIQSEERRVNAYKKSYKKKLKDAENKERSNYYVLDPATNKFKKVTVPLTNAQIKSGEFNGQRLYRAKVENPNLGSSADFEKTSEGELSRFKSSVRAGKREVAESRYADMERNLETAAWRAQIKNDNLNVTQVSDAMKKMAADPKTMNPVQLSAYASALVADGAVGRDALEALMADKKVQENVTAIKAIADGMTQTELNSINKKNPILSNKLKMIRENKTGTYNVGDLANDKNFAITEKQLDGLSPKHLAEMDPSAQRRVVENLLSTVEADAKALHDPRTIKALALAEGALDNAVIRSTMSPEQVANLEQIKNIRRTAVESEAAKTIRSDRAALRPSTDYQSMSTEDVGQVFRKDFSDVFLKENVRPGGNDGVLTALTSASGCDTIRMEAITKAANAQLDEILRGKGLSGKELTNAREDIMRGVMEDMDKAIRQKSKTLISAATDNDAKKALQQQSDSATSICDVIIQRINLRS